MIRSGRPLLAPEFVRHGRSPMASCQLPVPRAQTKAPAHSSPLPPPPKARAAPPCQELCKSVLQPGSWVRVFLHVVLQMSSFCPDGFRFHLPNCLLCTFALVQMSALAHVQRCACPQLALPHTEPWRATCTSLTLVRRCSPARMRAPRSRQAPACQATKPQPLHTAGLPPTSTKRWPTYKISAGSRADKGIGPAHVFPAAGETENSTCTALARHRFCKKMSVIFLRSFLKSLRGFAKQC